MSADRYILNAASEPVPEPDLLAWARWFECAALRRVANTRMGEAEVSTVFLGLDHSWGDGPPVLWETMVFGGPLAQEQDRCSGSRAEAKAMHERMVARVQASV